MHHVCTCMHCVCVCTCTLFSCQSVIQLEVNQALGHRYQPLAVSNVKCWEVVSGGSGGCKVHGKALLIGVGAMEGCVSAGSVEYWMKLKLPITQAAKLYQVCLYGVLHGDGDLLYKEVALSCIGGSRCIKKPSNFLRGFCSVIFIKEFSASSCRIASRLWHPSKPHPLPRPPPSHFPKAQTTMSSQSVSSSAKASPPKAQVSATPLSKLRPQCGWLCFLQQNAQVHM